MKIKGIQKGNGKKKARAKGITKRRGGGVVVEETSEGRESSDLIVREVMGRFWKVKC